MSDSIGVYEKRARTEAENAIRSIAVAASSVGNQRDFALAEAQVHATLAVAFATLATSQGERVP